MNLTKEEILYYIKFLEHQIKSVKDKKLKNKYTEQQKTLLYLLKKKNETIQSVFIGSSNT